MNFTEYEVLVVLAEELNMRKAAERLFITQPALSQRLQTIEQNWNVKIFFRSQRGLMLTPAGEKIVQLAKEVLAKTEQVRDEVRQIQGEVSGTLKLAVASIIAQHWLPSILKRFTEAYPHVKISLTTGWTSEIMASMYGNKVHIGIVRGVQDWNGVTYRLFTDRLFLVDKKIKCLDELLQTERPFIQFKSDSTYHLHIQRWWHERFQTFPERTIIVDQIETCKQLAYAGIGYAILPEIALRNMECEMKQTPLTDQAGNPITRDTWLIGFDSAFRLPQVQAFRKIIDEFVS